MVDGSEKFTEYLLSYVAQVVSDVRFILAAYNKLEWHVLDGILQCYRMIEDIPEVTIFPGRAWFAMAE